MSKAVSGHGITLGKELDPVGHPGVFSTVAEVMGDFTWPPESRTKTDITPQNENSDSYVYSYWIRGAMSLNLNYLFGHATHSFVPGGLQGDLARNQIAGYRITGPGQTPGAGIDEWIYSGNVETFARVSKNKAEDSAKCTVQPSGPMLVNGVSYG